MGKVIERIDAVAMDIARSMEIVAYALDGLFEKTVRDNPTMQGIGDFARLADTLIFNAHQLALVKMSAGDTMLEASLSDSERAFLNSYDADVTTLGEAPDAFWGAFQQVRAVYVKRLREIAAARAFGTDTFNPNPKVMTRNGRRWNFNEYVYLTARGLLVDRYNETKIGYIASIGGTQFVLDDETESVYEVVDYPALSEELFHPRTSKLVGGIYVST